MFDFDKWQEIFHTISKNKLRTFLTAFSVAWGIFILIILLGSGQAMRNGAEYQFQSDAVNSIWIQAGTTSKAYKGFQPGRDIQLKNDDYELLKSKVDGIEHMSSVFQGGMTKTLSYKKEHGAFTVRSCRPDHQYLENCKMITGRFINDMDMKMLRKVCAMG